MISLEVYPPAFCIIHMYIRLLPFENHMYMYLVMYGCTGFFHQGANATFAELGGTIVVCPGFYIGISSKEEIIVCVLMCLY